MSWSRRNPASALSGTCQLQASRRRTGPAVAALEGSMRLTMSR